MTGFADDLWYVLVDNQSYGPYSAADMMNFVGEGRIIAESLISAHPQTGFLPAAQTPAFQVWMSRAMGADTHHAQSQSSSAPQNTPVHTHYRQPNAATQPQGRPDKLFLVMAEIDPQTGMNFLRALQSFGHVQRIGDTVWLLKATQDLQEIKSSLGVTLSKRDRLFIHDCFSNQQAWENIGADLDTRIRQIWQGLKR